MTTGESRYFLIAIIILFVGLISLLLSGFLTPLVLGTILAAISYRWYKKLLVKLPAKENLAALLTLLLIVTVVIAPTLILIALLTREAFEVFVLAQAKINLSDNPVTPLLQVVAEKFSTDAETMLQTQIFPALKNFGVYLSNQLSGILSDALQLFVGFFVMLVTIFYLLRDGRALGEFLVKFSPLKTEDELFIFQTFKKVSRAVFYGNFVSALAQGSLGGLGFWLFGLESPVLWGATMSFLALIPLLGPYLIFLPATAYLLIAGKTSLAIGFLIYNIALVSSIDNIIRPKFISEEIKIHPLLILLSILGALKIFGILGIIYGPLIVAIFFALLDIYLKSSKIDSSEKSSIV